MKLRIILLLSLFLSVCTLSATVVAYATSPETDQQRTTITVNENGDAIWTIEIRTELQSETDTENFQSWMDELETNNAEFRSEYQQRFESIVSRSAAELERSMSVQDVSVTADLEPTPTGDWGVNRITFTWTSFATVTDGRIEVGDAFHGGYAIGNSERLTIEGPPNHRIDSATVAGSQSDNRIDWTGPFSFDSDEPNVVFVESTDSASSGSEQGYESQSDDEGMDGSEQGYESQSDDEGMDIPVWIIGLLLAALSGYVALLYKASKANSVGSGSDELKTDAERVQDVVRSNGGRMKQKTLLDTLEWSEAKVSRVTSQLEDTDAIKKLRIGRENVVEIVEE